MDDQFPSIPGVGRAVRISLLAMLLFVLFAGLGAPMTSASDDLKSWRIVQSIGDVSITAPDIVITKPRPGTVLPPLAIIVTGTSGRAILSRRGQQIVMQPKSRLELTPDTGARTVLRQIGGVAIFKVDHRTAPHFEVETPYLAAIVKGTRFEVRVNDEDTQVNVFEGKVQVRSMNSRATAVVMPGAFARVTSAMPQTIQLREKTGKTRDITIDEGSPGTGDLHAPDYRSNAPDLKVVVEFRGGDAASGNRAPAAQEGGTGTARINPGMARRNTGPRLRLSDGETATSNKQETTLRFSHGVADELAPRSEAALPAARNSDDNDPGPKEPPSPPGGTRGKSNDLFRKPSRDGFMIPGTSTRVSFLDTHQLNIQGRFPWWEVGAGALAIVSLLTVTATRGFILRRRKRQRERDYDFY
jgi:hypothetical protein